MKRETYLDKGFDEMLRRKREENILTPKEGLKDDGIENIHIANDTIREEKLNGVLITGTSHASAGTESSHAHGLGKTPTAWWPLPTANGVIYKSKASDATNIYVKASANSVTFEAYCLL